MRLLRRCRFESPTAEAMGHPDTKNSHAITYCVPIWTTGWKPVRHFFNVLLRPRALSHERDRVNGLPVYPGVVAGVGGAGDGSGRAASWQARRIASFMLPGLA